MEKPITMRIDETKAAIVNAINAGNLPSFVLEPMIRDIYTEVAQLALKEAANERVKYEESLSDSDKENK